MAVRNKRIKCRRGNCPEKVTSPAQAKAAPTVSVLKITSEGEGERLWKHVLFGTGTCVGMIEGYAALAMPGNPLEAIVSLRDRLNKLIHKYEALADEDQPSEE